MSYTKETPNLHLPQYAEDDVPSWLSDINGAFESIDSGHAEVQATAQNAAAASEQAVTAAGNASNIAEGLQTTVEGHVADIQDLKDDVAVNKGNVALLQAAVDDNTTDIGVLQKQVEDIEAGGGGDAAAAIEELRGGYNGTLMQMSMDIDGNAADIASAEADITALTNKVNSTVATEAQHYYLFAASGNIPNITYANTFKELCEQLIAVSKQYNSKTVVANVWVTNTAGIGTEIRAELTAATGTSCFGWMECTAIYDTVHIRFMNYSTVGTPAAQMTAFNTYTKINGYNRFAGWNIIRSNYPKSNLLDARFVDDTNYPYVRMTISNGQTFDLHVDSTGISTYKAEAGQGFNHVCDYSGYNQGQTAVGLEGYTSGSVWYRVRNGICFLSVQALHTTQENYGLKFQITGLPAPSDGLYYHTAVTGWNNAIFIGCLEIANGSTVASCFSPEPGYGGPYYATLVYPVG